MSSRSLIAALTLAGALALPAAASAAPTVTASAVPSTPQDCQAGCIWSQRLSCTATDAQSVQTTVRCWVVNHSGVTATQAGPAAVANGTITGHILATFTLCVEGTARYSNGTTASSGVKCTSGGDLGAAFIYG